MKKIYTIGILLLILSGSASYAQWTTAGTITTTSNTIGIGTASPQSNVEISNGSYSNGNQLIISGGETTRYYGVVETTVPSGHTVFSLGTKSNFVNYFQTLNLVNGNVGIGTTTPNGLLSLGNAIQHQKLIIHDGGNSIFGMGVQNNQFEQYINNGSSNNHFSWGNLTTDGNFNFSELMRLTTTGNLGIGTVDNANWQLANSTYKLAVAGKVVAESVTVKLQANWPDYVFKPSYTLTPLSEVKTYINQNHHLPEMPSEKEVAEKGLDLGEIVKLQTKKIEELTLYLIELKTEKDKKDKEQQLQIDQLKKQVNALTTRNENNLPDR